MKKENYKEISTRCNLFLTSKTGTTGITLIALVITIIVLLILAAVSITTLTGENGLLTKANDAKVATEKAEAKEQVEMAVMASYDDNGILDYDKLKENLNKIPKIAEIPDEITEESFPLKVKVNGYEVTIENNGKVKGDNPETPPTGEKSTLEQAKDNGTIFGEKTTLEDEYRNKVVVPENFKIAKDSATDVAGGVVIEDASEELTKGSQFVWIPVGDVKKGTETKNIKLSRYTFANGTSDKGSNGNILEKGTPIEQGQTAIKNGSYEFTENHNYNFL